VDCWICKTTALGTCRFCGRGICGDHAKFLPFILEVYHPRTKEPVQALVVEDALCHQIDERISKLLLPI